MDLSTLALNILTLKLIPYIGNKTIHELLQCIPDLNTTKVHYDLVHKYLGKQQKESMKKLDDIDKKLEKLLLHLHKNSIHVVTINDEGYPLALKMTYNAPVLFLYKGTLQYDFERSLAVIGTRSSTEYGEKQCECFVEQCVRSGLSIISGLASGIDTIAHTTSLRENGYCIGVLGHGFDFCFPSSNWRLYQNIIESGGALVTEYLPHEPPIPGNFPARNRIVAGLAKSTFVVEATENSGSLITAESAFAENRTVFALPADVNRKESIGCNTLIKREIAKLVTTPEDILIEYQIETRNTVGPNHSSEEIPSQFQEIYDCIRTKRFSTHEIYENLTIELSYLTELLSEMEILGYIKQDRNLKWCIQ